MLLQQRHLHALNKFLPALLTFGSKAINIDTARYRFTVTCSSVPDRGLVSRRLHSIHERENLLTGNIEYLQPDVGSLAEVVSDLGIGIEGIGVVLR